MGRLRGIARAVPTSFWAAALVQTVFLVALAASDGYDVARSGETVRVVLTYTTLLALFGLVHLAVSNAKWSTRVATFIFACFVALNFARFETAGSFDYGFAHENIRELFTPLGRRIVLSNFHAGEVALLFVVPLAIGFALMRAVPSRPWPGSWRSRAVVALVCFAFLAGLPLARVSTHETLSGFFVSALRFHAESRAAEASIGGEPFPFVKDSVPSPETRPIAGGEPRPHVILLLLESWSGVYGDKARPNGQKFTPVFDERRREGLSFDHFYGNSVQSSRGHFATLCSLIPMYRGKEFVDIPDTRLRCLPQVLRDGGYDTAFFSATDEPTFDSGDKFYPRIGFADVRFAPDRSKSPDASLWGVGVQDDVFYRRAFTSLDEKIARAPNVPIFVVLANASNHYPFDKNPAHVADPGYPTKYRRNYVASLGASDAWLTTFFEELEKRPAFADAIVVLVGDHSFPADEHGIHFNGVGAFEEAFRTSFMLRWKGHVTPTVVSDRAASQLDIAPTIIDLLQLRTKTHFAGKSLFARGGDVPPVPLVQPYDGVRLGAVKWPYKLVRHESAEQEHLYDLAKDPDEQHDRIGDPLLAAELAKLRETIVRIHASETLLRGNRVWPREPPRESSP